MRRAKPRQRDTSENEPREKGKDMIELFGSNIGESWSDIIRAVAAFGATLGAGIGGWFAYKKWAMEKATKRWEILDSLLRKFRDDKIRSVIASLDSSGGASEIIANARPGSEDARCVEDSLMFLSQLCYFQMSKAISDKEFSLFKDSVLKVLDDDDVKRYIDQSLRDMEIDDADSRYGILMEYARLNGLDMSVRDKVSPLHSAQEGHSSQNGQDQYAPNRGGPISRDEFEQPTVIIKINRFYREGMDDAQVYDTVRGWWRLKREVAEKVKLVLAVAYGDVKGVYKVDRWVDPIDPKEVGRIGFEGAAADKATCDKFMNRSVRALFSKGAANPVRYFNVKEN